MRAKIKSYEQHDEHIKCCAQAIANIKIAAGKEIEVDPKPITYSGMCSGCGRIYDAVGFKIISKFGFNKLIENTAIDLDEGDSSAN